MLKVFGVLVAVLVSVPSYAKVCGSLFVTKSAPATKLLRDNTFTGYAKPATDSNSHLNLRPLYVHLKNGKRTQLVMTYGDIIFGGYQTIQLRLTDKISDKSGNTILTYSYLKNGRELVTLKALENSSDGQKVTHYQLVLKSEVTTPSNSERTYQFSANS